MPEVGINVGNLQVVTIRLEPTDVFGSDTPAWARLTFRFQIQLLPGQGQQEEFNYALLRLAGYLDTPKIGRFAEFEAGPLVEESRPYPLWRQLSVDIDLDHRRIRKFEDARSGADARFDIQFSGLAWVPKHQKFEIVRSSGLLQVSVPRSHWADQVVSRWGLDRVKLVEVRFPESQAGDNFRAAYGNVEAAEKLYASGQWKQVLAELHSAFQRLAKSYGCENPDQQFFVRVLEALHPAKKEKMKLALDYLCEFLHLGRKETRESPDTFSVSPKDARFALTLVHAIFEYITLGE